jgi:hypothetical protein
VGSTNRSNETSILEESTMLTSDVIAFVAVPFDRLFTVCATGISSGSFVAR